MDEVGIRELKAKLSSYIDRAKNGETIVVTERGIPVARLIPATASDAIARGIREGWIRPGNGAPPQEIRRRFKATRTVQEMMDEDRGE